ncbi:4a-hydroxytetrahydrobiopterin dehydratase [Polyangium fumosum]|uniref:Putative pterin-4-alpha-carbinolamine dehydratase n=1 Tax=Polyangium fumosum TaxID=889272 RepID=A0A4U1JGI0_9BACT|nr:4a-hydroxytetrahydrobiopterin dehydratase [Polyangium fumosum]TKD09738.1 4a-hydroxytetrahydrobiopterin dehydratase [Polyangium fumosum]
MSKRQKLEDDAVATFLGAHAGWSRAGEAIQKTYKFPDFSTALAFVVRVGLAAEKRDHHPDVHLGWGRVTVVWSTHDAGGITGVDTEMAEATDRLYGGP